MAEASKNESSGSIKMITSMGGVGLISGILIVFTFQYTLPIIKKNKAEFLKKAVFKVLPGSKSKRTFAKTKEGKFILSTNPDDPAFKIYAGYDDNKKLTGIAIEAQGQGFQDVVAVIYGYRPSCECIVGMMVLDSRETPGLGDKIEKDEAFIANFKDLDVKLTPAGDKLQNPIVPVKKGAKTEKWQIETITGATISAKAIAKILLKSTQKVLPLIKKNINDIRDFK